MVPAEYRNWILRAQRENLIVASGVYIDGQGTVRVHPAVAPNTSGELVRGPGWTSDPPDFEGALINSTIVREACSYIDQLGKVFCSIGTGNGARFRAFVDQFMEEYKQECLARNDYDSDTLWSVVRNGFIHQFAHERVMWDRVPSDIRIFLEATPGLYTVNVDGLVEGFLLAQARFNAWFESQTSSGALTEDDFQIRLEH